VAHLVDTCVTPRTISVGSRIQSIDGVGKEFEALWREHFLWDTAPARSWDKAQMVIGRDRAAGWIDQNPTGNIVDGTGVSRVRI
jgi:hypothetical protein